MYPEPRAICFGPKSLSDKRQDGPQSIEKPTNSHREKNQKPI